MNLLHLTESHKVAEFKNYERFSSYFSAHKSIPYCRLIYSLVYTSSSLKELTLSSLVYVSYFTVNESHAPQLIPYICFIKGH